MTKVALINKIALAGVIVLTLILASGQLSGLWQVPESSATTYYADPFAKLNLTAKAAVVYDPDKNEIIYAKNAYQALPLASITKVMTALVASEQDTNQTVNISASALSTEGDSGLAKDESWSLKKLIDFTLISSSNDGAAALAAAGGTNFIANMNSEAKSLGLVNTEFVNPTGLDIGPGVAGNMGSALDVARLLAYVLKTKPELLAATSERQSVITSQSDLNHVAVNTNQLAGRLPGLFASKTGFTDTAGGNLAVAVDLGLNQPVIAVVLGSTEEGRFADIEQLINTARGDHYLTNR